MKTYWASIEFRVGPGEGYSSNIEYDAESDANAVRDAARFAANRCRAFDGWEFTAIKVGHFRTAPIAPDGMLTMNNHGANFFEWKCDWPETLEERIYDRLED